MCLTLLHLCGILHTEHGNDVVFARCALGREQRGPAWTPLSGGLADDLEDRLQRSAAKIGCAPQTLTAGRTTALVDSVKRAGVFCGMAEKAVAVSA